MFWIKWIGGDGRLMEGRKTHECIAVNCKWCGQINNLWSIHCRYYISNSNSLIYYIVSYGWWWCNFFCLMSVHAFSPTASNETNRWIYWITDDRMLCTLLSNRMHAMHKMSICSNFAFVVLGPFDFYWISDAFTITTVYSKLQLGRICAVRVCCRVSGINISFHIPCMVHWYISYICSVCVTVIVSTARRIDEQNMMMSMDAIQSFENIDWLPYSIHLEYSALI